MLGDQGGKIRWIFDREYAVEGNRKIRVLQRELEINSDTFERELRPFALEEAFVLVHSSQRVLRQSGRLQSISISKEQRITRFRIDQQQNHLVMDFSSGLFKSLLTVWRLDNQLESLQYSAYDGDQRLIMQLGGDLIVGLVNTNKADSHELRILGFGDQGLFVRSL